MRVVHSSNWRRHFLVSLLLSFLSRLKTKHETVRLVCTSCSTLHPTTRENSFLGYVSSSCLHNRRKTAYTVHTIIKTQPRNPSPLPFP